MVFIIARGWYILQSKKKKTKKQNFVRILTYEYSINILSVCKKVPTGLFEFEIRISKDLVRFSVLLSGRIRPERWGKVFSVQITSVHFSGLAQPEKKALQSNADSFIHAFEMPLLF
jgi:hypothetical protein